MARKSPSAMVFLTLLKSACCSWLTESTVFIRKVYPLLGTGTLTDRLERRWQSCLSYGPTGQLAIPAEVPAQARSNPRSLHTLGAKKICLCP